MRYFLAIAAVLPLLGQVDTARLAGVVTDASGAAIANAKITLRNERTGIVREVTAGQDGNYIVTNLPPATYVVTGQAPGLGPTEYKDVSLVVGQERNLGIILQPASVTQQITVSGGALVT